MRRWSLNDVLDAERAAKKRSDARYRQQKHRSVVSSTAFQEIGSGFAVVQRAISAQSSLYCSICGCVHNRAWPCPCVRCHALHAVGSDCADSHQATVALEMPSSNAVTSDFCFICGCRHPPNADCPCNRCQSHHEADADCPVICHPATQHLWCMRQPPYQRWWESELPVCSMSSPIDERLRCNRK